MTRQEFIEMVSDIVMRVNAKRNFPLFSSVVIAQACLETGYGQSDRMMKSHAIFGIKATSSWKGKVYSTKTKECYDKVSFVTITDSFRAYNTFEESIEDYFDLICKSSRYRKSLQANSPRQCIQAIKDGGYATDPSYVDKIMNIIYSNNLERFDVESVDNYVESEEIEMKIYQNGSTSETVYSDTNLTKVIGSLNPKEQCDCLGIYQNRAIVRYQVGHTGNYKIGFVKWLGGVK